jgi:hypothetical protein
LELFISFYLPRNVANTKGGLRGFKSWFTPRQVQIAVTRVIKDDQSKREYEWVEFNIPSHLQSLILLLIEDE